LFNSISIGFGFGRMAALTQGLEIINSVIVVITGDMIQVEHKGRHLNTSGETLKS
jgi:hypothetical protein